MASAMKPLAGLLGARYVVREVPPPDPSVPDCPACADSGVVLVVRSEADRARLAPYPVPLARRNGADVALAWCADCPEDVKARRLIAGKLRPHETLSFETFTPRTPAQRNAKAAAIMWARGDAPKPFLVLSGPAGIGKTHLAKAAVAGRARAGYRVEAWRADDLLDELRASFDRAADGSQGQTTDALRYRWETTGVLVLDDYGAEYPTAWALKTLAKVISRRYEEGLPTLITTNLDFSGIGDRDDEFGRLTSRLSDSVAVAYFEIDGQDYRTNERGKWWA